MSYKHCCVVDAEDSYKTLVLVKTEPNLETDGTQETIQHYTLQDGERLIEANPPALRLHAGTAGYVRPRWDGDTAAWTEGATAAEIAAWEGSHPDPNAKTLEQLREDKLAELSAACNAAITAGMDVETAQGKEHFSLQETDQINLSTALSAVQAGASGYPYHADGALCRVFSAEEIQAVADMSVRHKLYHTTYYNHLAAWVRRVETAEELAGITYGTALPQDLASNMTTILDAAGGGADAV